MQEGLEEILNGISEFNGFVKNLKPAREALQSLLSWIKKKWPGGVPEPIDIEHSFWRIDFFNALELHSFSRNINISHETYIAKLSDNPFVEINPEDKFEFYFDFNEDTGKLRGAWVEGDGPKAKVFVIEATLSNDLDVSGTWWLANTNTRGTWKGLNLTGSVSV